MKSEAICGRPCGTRRRSAESLEAFACAFDERRGVYTADDYGRFCFNRSLGHHFRGNRGRALDDLGRTLVHTSLDSPRGYFLDTPAMAAVYVLGGDRRHDRQALEMVEGLEERIRGLPGWADARTRILWVKGLLHARLGHLRRARRYLTTAQRQLLDDGLPREAVAVTLDLAQLGCRHWELTDRNVETAREVLGRCLRKRGDLPSEHRIELERLRNKVLVRHPYEAFRLSFIAPVPNRLDERIEQR